jgi:murE/murF fusion protein
VVTSDNPRSEVPARIIDEILAGMTPAESSRPRRSHPPAVLGADVNDVILLAGKGHEPYQEIAGIRTAVLRCRAGAGGARLAPQCQRRWWHELAALAIARRRRLLCRRRPWRCRRIHRYARRGAGQLFIALRGERFDAHDFLEQAVASRCRRPAGGRWGALPAGVSALVVADTRLALGRLAAAWRARFEIAGDRRHRVQRQDDDQGNDRRHPQGPVGDAVLATRGNLNNDIGLPLTLLGLNAWRIAPR